MPVHAVCFTRLAVISAAFVDHILRIIFMGAGHQMFRVNAKAIVARMHNKQAFRDAAVIFRVANSVCILRPDTAIPSSAYRA
jgi:hypothetical protein